MPIAAVPTNPDPSAAIAQAAGLLLPDLERGRRFDAATLRAAMETAFGGSDAEGAWDWKTAYDACEAATVLFLRKFGPAMCAKAASPGAMLPMLAKIAGLLPTHTRRSEESQALQQFSTPITLAGLIHSEVPFSEPERWARLGNAPISSRYRIRRDRRWRLARASGSGRMPRSSRVSELQTERHAAEQLGVGACRGECNTHPRRRFRDAGGDLDHA